MKKKILVILSIVMVFALTLTGCGQKGSQDASAGNSEKETVVTDKNGSEELDENEEDEEADEPEIGGDSVGFHGAGYTYRIYGEDFYIETDLASLMDGSNCFPLGKLHDYYRNKSSSDLIRHGDYSLFGISVIEDGVIEFKIFAWNSDNTRDSSRDFTYTLESSPDSARDYYIPRKANNFYISYEQVILATYELERLSETIDTNFLNDKIESTETGRGHYKTILP